MFNDNNSNNIVKKNKEVGNENLQRNSLDSFNVNPYLKINNANLLDQEPINEKTNSSIKTEVFEEINNKFSENQNSLPCEFLKKSTRIEDLIDNGEYNMKNVKAIIFCALFMFIEGFYLSYFNFILIPFQKYYDISDTLLQTIASITFLGMAIGSSLTGHLSSKFSRRSIIITCVFCILILQLFLSFIYNAIIFTLARFTITIFLGSYMVLILNIMTEYLPNKFRAFLFNSLWNFWNFGAIFFLLLCKIFVPNLDYDPNIPFSEQNFHLAIFQLFYVILFTLIIYILYLEDSPRNLILNGKLDEAKNILEYFTSNKITDDDMKNIEKHLLNSGENKFYNNEAGYIKLFEKRIRMLTIVMMFVYFFLSMASYGITVATPIILSKLHLEKTNSTAFEILNNQNSTSTEIILPTPEKGVANTSDNTINNLILVYAIGILGNFAAGIVSEFKIIGKKYSEIVFFLLSFIFGIISILLYQNFSFWIGLSLSLLGAAFNIHINYTEELYPTKIRDFALGCLFGMTRLGGFISQYLFISFGKASLFFSLYAYLFMILIKIILIFLLPNDNNSQMDGIICFEDSMLISKEEPTEKKKINFKEFEEEDNNLLHKEN